MQRKKNYPVVLRFFWPAALALGVLLAAKVRAESPASDGADAQASPERIYTSIVPGPVGTRAPAEVVAIDPQTGRCETLVSNGMDPRLSPDGKRLAFYRFGKAEEIPGTNVIQSTSEVCVSQLHSAAEPRMIWSGTGSISFCWTRDGKKLFVAQGVSPDHKKWQHTTWLVDPETSQASKLTIPDTDMVTDYARKTQRVLTWSNRNGHTQVFSMLPDGSDAVALTEQGKMAYSGRFSADDAKIAFSLRQGGTLSVCTADADGKNMQVAWSEQGLTTVREFCWSPDAKRLAVVLWDWSVDAEGKKFSRPDQDNHYRIVLMDLDGKNAQELKLDRAVFGFGKLDWR